MKRRRVLSYEQHEKSGYHKDRIYPHYFRVVLACGHTCNARPIKGGDCPATVTCDKCYGGEDIYKGPRAWYQGRLYRLLWKGPTRYGDRARLVYLDGSKEFWVDLEAIEQEEV